MTHERPAGCPRHLDHFCANLRQLIQRKIVRRFARDAAIGFDESVANTGQIGFHENPSADIADISALPARVSIRSIRIFANGRGASIHGARSRLAHCFRRTNCDFREDTMRKLSLLLITTAGLALVGMAAAPALAEVRINIGTPSYSQPTYGYYGYNRSPYYTPYYGNPNNYNSYYYPGYSTYRDRGYNTYSSPYSRSYDRYDYPGYYQR